MGNPGSSWAVSGEWLFNSGRGRLGVWFDGLLRHARLRDAACVVCFRLGRFGWVVSVGWFGLGGLGWVVSRS